MFGRKTCTQLGQTRSNDALRLKMITPLRQRRLPLNLVIRPARVLCLAGTIANGSVSTGLIGKIYASLMALSEQA